MILKMNATHVAMTKEFDIHSYTLRLSRIGALHPTDVMFFVPGDLLENLQDEGESEVIYLMLLSKYRIAVRNC